MNGIKQGFGVPAVEYSVTFILRVKIACILHTLSVTSRTVFNHWNILFIRH